MTTLATAGIAAGLLLLGTTVIFRPRCPRIGPLARHLLWWSVVTAGWLLDSALRLPRAEWDLLGGGSLLVLAMVLAFWIGNIGHGFRLLMLDALATTDWMLLDQWMAAYGSGRGMWRFLGDRLVTILLPCGLVRVSPDALHLTPRGRALARVLVVVDSVLPGGASDDV